MPSSSPFRNDCLNSRVALITGGGSGICFEITNQLLQHGLAGAVICGRRKAFLERAARLLMEQQQHRNPYSSRSSSHQQPVVLYQVCDVRDPRQCQQAVQFAVEQFGRLDILINGAAGNFLAEAKSLSPKGFATVMQIDAHGTFNMCSAAYPALARQAATTAAATATSNSICTTTSSSDQATNNNNDCGPIIINISATLQYGATWWQSHPSAAKAAVDSLTRSLALEWGSSDGIRVVGIAPGATADTPGTTKLAPPPGLLDDASSMENAVVEGIPLGRMGEKKEIGLAAVYLCTANYVTGHVLVVDGGEWLYRPPLVPKNMVGELSRKVEARSRAQGPESML